MNPTTTDATVNLVFETESGVRRCDVHAGEALTTAAHRAGLLLNTRCGGKGSCLGCRLVLHEGHYSVNEQDLRLGPGDAVPVMACQTRVMEEGGRVEVPFGALVEAEGQIVMEFDARETPGLPPLRRHRVSPLPHPAGLAAGFAAALQCPLSAFPLAVLAQLCPEEMVFDRVGEFLLRASPASRSTRALGLAVDIGTTTVAALLVDLENGEVLQRASRYNQQIGRADDVASRISCCTSPEEVEDLRHRVVDQTVARLMQTLCEAAGVGTDEIVLAALAGNTVMMHLFLGISPEEIGRVPFRPVLTDVPPLRGSELGLPMAAAGLVHFVPAVAGYIGGDVTADLLVAGMSERNGRVLLVDIGTNGEVVLSDKGELTACATAAGPAFEGAGIRHGCRAAAGAIEGVQFDAQGNPVLKVIGGKRPIGLCGSGVVDFVAAAWREGLINEHGRFDRAALETRGLLCQREHPCGTSYGCVLCPASASANGVEIAVTEYDVSQILKAKAALYAGMKTLLAARGLGFEDLDCLILAGGFAQHLHLANAIEIGLLPDIPLSRIEVIGNGALAGALRLLLDHSAMSACQTLARHPTVLELNLDPGFSDHFIDALSLPESPTHHGVL